MRMKTYLYENRMFTNKVHLNFVCGGAWKELVLLIKIFIPGES